jgi:hypothetical protein
MTPVRLQITHQHDIYRVTRDGVFHGDYTRKLWAVESAEEIARALRKQGRQADILELDGQAAP